MANNKYHFITNWHLPGTVEEISEILSNGPDLVRWWPAVYLHVQETKAGQENGLGMEISLYTKGWLPYTLRWQFRVIENRRPFGFSIEAWGDFVGHGIWTFTQIGEYVDIIYDWNIQAEKSLLRRFSFLFKPIFAANHHWAMAQGEKSLSLELQRRHAAGAAELAAIPPPPGPTFKWLIRGTPS